MTIISFSLSAQCSPVPCPYIQCSCKINITNGMHCFCIYQMYFWRFFKLCMWHCSVNFIGYDVFGHVWWLGQLVWHMYEKWQIRSEPWNSSKLIYILKIHWFLSSMKIHSQHIVVIILTKTMVLLIPIN